jgi:hypothetical protein
MSGARPFRVNVEAQRSFLVERDAWQRYSESILADYREARAKSGAASGAPYIEPSAQSRERAITWKAAYAARRMA